MIQAKIVITVKYAPDADMDEASGDKNMFYRELVKYFGASIAGRPDDIQLEYAITEVEETKTVPMPSWCPKCREAGRIGRIRGECEEHSWKETK